jgi:hypothetical protein
MVKLKKCGCGGDGILSQLYPVNDLYRVRCEKCQIATKGYIKKEEAIEAWNTAMGMKTSFICGHCDGVNELSNSRIVPKE